MSGLKIIRRRIASVKSTKQITRAMKLVSAAKLRKAHDLAVESRFYLQELENVLHKTTRFISPSFQHPLLRKNTECNLRRVIVISGERGLCGAYNANILKLVQRREVEGNPSNCEFVAIGRRAANHARRYKWNLVSTLEGLPEDASSWPLEDILIQSLNDFSAGKIAELAIYYTHFVTALTQRVERQVILPFTPNSDLENQSGSTETPEEPYCRFSPNAESIFAETITLVLRAKLQQAALESKASEHAARMTAMDAATNNADDLIEKLRLRYNRARQAAITRELIDIVGGAEAIK